MAAFTEYQNHNNGERGNLTFPTVGAHAVGATATVEVTRSEEGMYDCAHYTSLFGDDEVRCTFAGHLSPVKAVVAARCDGAGCISVADGTSVRVTGLGAGSFTVVVSASLEDGTALEDVFHVTFATVDAINVQCTEAHRCPGPHAIFVGAAFYWATSSSSVDAGTLEGPVAIAGVEPAGIVDAVYITDVTWGQRLLVRGLAPGVATLRLRAGSVELERTIRVASIDEVVSGEVRLPLDDVQDKGFLDADTEIVGAVPPQQTEIFPATFVPVWVLRDGTYALGGAGRVKATSSDIEIHTPADAGPSDVEVMFFMVGGVSCRPGRTGITARMGSATLDWSYDHQCL